MEYMFYNCNNLEYIDFTSNDIIYINNMFYMFSECKSLKYLDLISFETSNVTKMEYMFYKCQSLLGIKNIHFNISSVLFMNHMFYYCNSLTSLDLSNLASPKNYVSMHEMFYHCGNLKYIQFPKNEILKLNSIDSMFYECSALISLDLSNFDTSKVQNMSYAFYYCSNLININLTNFNTSSANDMFRMFKYCSSLQYVNLSSFDTSKVTYMRAMFCCCNKLISLDLSHFDTSKVTDIRYMFESCSSLTYLNIYNFTTSSLTEYVDSVFISTNGFEYCLRENNAFFDKQNDGLYYDERKIRDCSDKCYKENRTYIPSTKLCVCNCQTYNLFEYNSECINKCPKRTITLSNNTCQDLNCSFYYNFEQDDCIEEIPQGYYLNDSLLKTINKCNKECKTCNNESTNYNLCISCNDDYYPKINDNANINPYVKCYYDKIQGHYFDKNGSIFKPCYHSCKNCDLNGNEYDHKCLECNSEYKYELWKDNNLKNCFKK